MGKGKLLRKGMAMLLAVVMIIGFLPGVGSLEVSAEESGMSETTITPTKPEKGDGTAENPYQIGTAAELYWFADKVNNENATYKNANAVLTADIVVNKNVLKSDGTLNKGSFKEWIPIGRDDDYIYGKSYSYAGMFDGQNHTISGLYYNSSEDGHGGLFGKVVSEGWVVNIGILDSYFKGTYCVGGVCGQNDEGRITNCYNTGTVSGYMYVGGVCGQNDGGRITNCYNTGTVSGSTHVGGVCGQNDGGRMENCYNTGTVTYIENDVMDQFGGVCGDNYDGIIENCYNIGNVSGVKQVGGVCGYNLSVNGESKIQNCYNTGAVSGSQDVGGVLGLNEQGTIENCYYDSKVYTKDAIGKDESGTATKVKGKTTDEFKSGEVAYLLQEGQKEEGWGQKIGSDNSPVLGGSKVYKKNKYSGCEGKPGNAVSYFYSNTDKNKYAPHMDDGSLEGSVAYDNKCDLCGEEIHSFKEDGSCKDAGCVYHKGIITNVSYPTKIVYSGDVANAEPKAGDFTVNSGQALTFNWYQGDVTTGTPLGAAPKEAGTYTLVVTAAGAKVGDVIYTAAELRVLVTIEKEAIKEQPTTQQPSSTTTEQQPSGTTAQPPKNGDVVTDEKTKAKFEVTDVSKKEVIYHAPTDNKAKDITVPDTVTINGEVYKVTKIADNAFKGNKTLTSITIGSNIQTIGKNAFSGCKKLKTIIIKSKTLTDKKIAKKAFKGISKKTVIKVPKKKLAAYKKLFKKKGLSSKNKVKGY